MELTSPRSLRIHYWNTGHSFILDISIAPLQVAPDCSIDAVWTACALAESRALMVSNEPIMLVQSIWQSEVSNKRRSLYGPLILVGLVLMLDDVRGWELYHRPLYGRFLDEPFQDFGIWERGDKSNTGLPELNCTSVGMAKVSRSVCCHQYSTYLLSPWFVTRAAALLWPPPVNWTRTFFSPLLGQLLSVAETWRRVRGGRKNISRT